MKRYEAYKNSGVDWIGEIPEHWDFVKVKNIFKLIVEPAPIKNDFELLSVYTDIGVKPRKELVEKGNKASTTDGYWKVRKGDFIVNKLLAWMGAVGVSEYDGVTSPAYDILRNKKEISHKFYHELFRNKVFNSEMKRHSTGIMEMRLRLYFDKFGDIRIPYPPIKEQQTIAEFLDNKTAKIDQLIGIKQKEIELLKERRQILIQQAVTGKIVWDASTNAWTEPVEVKDSGVNWIGEIPEHWEVRKTTYLFSKIGSGTTPTSGDLRFYDGNINFLQTGDLNDGYIVSTSKTLKENALRDFTSLKIYPKESLVIAMYGATIGKLGILNIDSATNQACCVLSNPRNVLTKYFFFVLLAFRKEIVSMGYGGGQPNISQDLIKSLRFPIPNLNEQTQIVSYLEDIEAKIAKAISIKEQEIEKLKEYKTVLIDNVVTGKVKIN